MVTLVGPGGIVTSYSHLHEAYDNDIVKQGDVIGTCGNTGSWSTGPHLHFESNKPFTF